MNLKKQYQRLFEGRAGHAKANNLIMNDALLEAPMVRAFPKMKTDAQRKAALEPKSYSDDTSPSLEPLDIEYYSDQLNKLIDLLRDYHQDIGTDVEMKGDESGNYEYETMEKQISRYIQGAEKQLDSLQKYLERQKGKGL